MTSPPDPERGTPVGPQPPRASIHDVARAAGVSTATVSNAFNRPEVVAERTLRRVREAVAAVGYVPDSAARVMRGAASPVVGCVLMNVANAFYAEITRGIEDGLRPHGILALIGSSDADHGREADYLRLMRSQRVRGIILNPTDAGAHDHPENSDLRMVLVDHPRGGSPLCAVTADHERGGYLLARHLIELGHRTLTLVWPHVDVESIRLREKGIRRACAEAGPHAQVEVRLVRPTTGRDGEPLDEPSLLRILRDEPRSTALMCFNDATALVAVRQLQRLSVRVPEEVSVTGYDDDSSSALLTPPLTTVRQPTRAMGLLAARLMLAEDEPGHRHVEHVLDVELQVRGSTAPPRPGG